MRDQLAELLRVPVADIEVTPTEIGGGFGGKISVYLEPVAALLSKESGCRPVKLVMTRRGASCHGADLRERGCGSRWERMQQGS